MTKGDSLETTPLSETFGVEVHGVDLAAASETHFYPAIRTLFEKQSVLLFRDQRFDDAAHQRLARLFGPIEDRKADERPPGEAFETPTVSNETADGGVRATDDLALLNLKANMLWHTDSTFLPTPALTNILVARVVTSDGGATELASTRAAWAEMPEALKTRIAGRAITHRYSHSRAKIAPELAALPMFNKWPDQRRPPVWTNPTNGLEALYVASHACAVDGYPDDEAVALLAELTAFCTQPRYVYAHRWRVGDVLLWDQRAVLHRATPWPYDQPRTLASICVSATDADGAATMRA